MYHVNPVTLAAGPCRAKKQCRFGAVAHYETKKEALEASENKIIEEKIIALLAPSPWQKIPWLRKQEIIETYARELMNEYLSNPLPKIEWIAPIEANGRSALARVAHGETAGSSVLQLTTTLAHIDEAKIKNTVIHEIAHLKLGSGSGHNTGWKTLAEEMAQKAGLKNQNFDTTYEYTLKELASQARANSEPHWLTICPAKHRLLMPEEESSLKGCAICKSEGKDSREILLTWYPLKNEVRHGEKFLAQIERHKLPKEIAGTWDATKNLLKLW